MPLNMNTRPKRAPKQRALLPTGPNVARIVEVIDLGLQPQRPYKGQEKPPAYEIYITFEFPNETIEVNGEERPMWKSKRLKLSSSELSTCYKFYNKLDPNNKFNGDWSKMIDMPCMALITHNAGRGKNEGLTFDDISDVMPMMKGLDCPPLQNDPKLFDLTSPDIEVFNAMPDWLQTVIKDNLEYDGSRLQNKLEGNPEKFTARAKGDAPEHVDSNMPEDAPEADIEDIEVSDEEPW